MSLRKPDARGVKKRLVVEIEDNGPGISTEAACMSPPCQTTPRSPCAYRSKPKPPGRL